MVITFPKAMEDLFTLPTEIGRHHPAHVLYTCRMRPTIHDIAIISRLICILKIAEGMKPLFRLEMPATTQGICHSSSKLPMAYDPDRIASPQVPGFNIQMVHWMVDLLILHMIQ
jgi:hypothetical protein